MRRTLVGLFVWAACVVVAGQWMGTVALGDGKIFPPRQYKGSIEERSQEAIILFHQSGATGKATEDLILKINVEGSVDVAETFGWVVPFPKEPTVSAAKAVWFKEIFDYVQARKQTSRRPSAKADGAAATKAAAPPQKVKVLSRKIVGTYDVAIVQETEAGGLNAWLEKEGFATLEDGDVIIEFYRKKKYVFACMKVAGAELSAGKPVDLHPLRFTFETGGRDGIYFPMKLSSLQDKPFDVNLYVFYKAWLNDHRSTFGFEHRGFELNYQDWDTPQCEPNAGKAWSAPGRDPFLKSVAYKIPALTKMFQTLHPGSRYYLTNIRARQIDPKDLADWPDDLWLFPHYTNSKFIPFDARPGGVAHGTYPQTPQSDDELDMEDSRPLGLTIFVVVATLILISVSVYIRGREPKIKTRP
jgi:hypothetical protein